MHQQRCGGNFIPTVFIGQGGGLLDGGEVFGSGWCVDMSHLYARGRRRLDIALS